jgi:hypothetical protein
MDKNTEQDKRSNLDVSFSSRSQTSRAKIQGNGQEENYPGASRPVETFTDRKMQLCGLCSRHLNETCLTVCQPGRRYAKFKLLPPERILFFPKPPTFEELLQWSIHEKLLYMYISQLLLNWLAEGL